MSESISTQTITTAPTIAILGVPFDNVTTAQTVELVERMVASRRPHYLATANVDFVVQALEDVELRQILFDAHLVLCDGTPLVWASRFLGNPLRERVAGSDLIPLLVGVAAQKGYRLFILGGREDVNQRAVARIKSQHPSVQIAGAYSPPFAPLEAMNHEDIVRRIKAAKPDILLVSFGCPKQEKWIAMHYRNLGVPVCVGVGATVDFLAGAMKRAPRWMHGLGIEWIFRLIQEPRRLFNRYMKDSWVIGRMLAVQWWRLRTVKKRHAQSQATLAPTADLQWEMLEFPPRLDAVEVERGGAVWEAALQATANFLFDVSHTQFVDSTGMGLLIRLAKRVRADGRLIILVAPTAPVTKALRMMRLQDFFHSATNLEAAKALGRDLLEQRHVDVPPKSRAGVIRLDWQGEITAVTSEKVWEDTVRLIPKEQQDVDLQISLRDVRFVDSSGLALMLRIKRFARQNGISLFFVDAQANVSNVARLAKLAPYLLEEAA